MFCVCLFFEHDYYCIKRDTITRRGQGGGANAQDRTPSRCSYGGRDLTNRATGGVTQRDDTVWLDTRLLTERAVD